MLRRFFMLFLICTTTFLLAAPKPVDSAFKKMVSLTGEWDGKDAEGMPVHSSFKPVISGTALMETISPHGMEEMLTLYSLDGDGIQLAHYCPTNNQPRMRAVPASADPKTLDFQFTGAGNLPDMNVGHQHRMIIQFDDADHITESWTWRQKNHDTPMVFHLSRKK